MSSLNRASILGNVGNEPEIRHTRNGDPVASLSIATGEKWRDKASGETKERTEWHRVVVWGEGLCGVIEKYVKKGAKVYVEGQLRTRKWQDQQGQDRFSTEIVVQGFQGRLVLCGGKPNGATADDADSYAPETSTRTAQSEADLDDEIPF